MIKLFALLVIFIMFKSITNMFSGGDRKEDQPPRPPVSNSDEVTGIIPDPTEFLPADEVEWPLLHRGTTKQDLALSLENSLLGVQHVGVALCIEDLLYFLGPTIGQADFRNYIRSFMILANQVVILDLPVMDKGWEPLKFFYGRGGVCSLGGVEFCLKIFDVKAHFPQLYKDYAKWLKNGKGYEPGTFFINLNWVGFNQRPKVNLAAVEKGRKEIEAKQFQFQAPVPVANPGQVPPSTQAPTSVTFQAPQMVTPPGLFPSKDTQPPVTPASHSQSSGQGASASSAPKGLPPVPPKVAKSPPQPPSNVTATDRSATSAAPIRPPPHPTSSVLSPPPPTNPAYRSPGPVQPTAPVYSPLQPQQPVSGMGGTPASYNSSVWGTSSHPSNLSQYGTQHLRDIISVALKELSDRLPTGSVDNASQIGSMHPNSVSSSGSKQTTIPTPSTPLYPSNNPLVANGPRPPCPNSQPPFTPIIPLQPPVPPAYREIDSHRHPSSIHPNEGNFINPPVPQHNSTSFPIAATSLDKTLEHVASKLESSLHSFSHDLIAGLKNNHRKKSEPYKLEPFYGEEGKGITLLRLREQVEALQDSHTDLAIRESLMQCLKGRAGTVAGTLPGRSWQDILTEMETRFRQQLPLDVMMSQFYDLTQGVAEDVAAYAARVEAQLCAIAQLYPSAHTSSQRDNLLRDRFFYGMLDSYKNSLRFLFKSPGTNFKDLLVEALSIEGEKGKVEDKKARVNAKANVVECSMPGVNDPPPNTPLVTAAPVASASLFNTSLPLSTWNKDIKKMERAYASSQGESAKLAKQVQELQNSFNQVQAALNQAQSTAATPYNNFVGQAASGPVPQPSGDKGQYVPPPPQRGGISSRGRGQYRPQYNRDPLEWNNLCWFCRGNLPPAEAAHKRRDCQMYNAYCQEFWATRGRGRGTQSRQPPPNQGQPQGNL